MAVKICPGPPTAFTALDGVTASAVIALKLAVSVALPVIVNVQAAFVPAQTAAPLVPPMYDVKREPGPPAAPIVTGVPCRKNVVQPAPWAGSTFWHRLFSTPTVPRPVPVNVVVMLTLVPLPGLPKLALMSAAAVMVKEQALKPHEAAGPVPPENRPGGLPLADR